MQFLAQTGLGGAAAAAVFGILILALLPVVPFIVAYGLPPLFRLIVDLVSRRDVFAESELDRQMDGRLFSLQPKPTRCLNRNLRPKRTQLNLF